MNTRIGKLDLDHGLPTKDAVAKLFSEMDFQRAVQCYIWGLPIVGIEGLREAQEHNAGAHNGDLVLYDTYRDKSTVLTPNMTTPYIIAFLDLAEHGPMVVEIPAGLTAGFMDDFWQRPITDTGVPGPEKGLGAKYLFVGPGQEAPSSSQSEGYRVLHSKTFNMMYGYRVLETDPQKAKAINAGVRIYAYSDRMNPSHTRFLTPKPDGELMTMVPPNGLDYWRRLSQALAKEPVEERDKFFAAMLRPLGIERGKPFGPNERQKEILTDAANVGNMMAKALAANKRSEGMRYRPDANWDFVLAPDITADFETNDYVQFDERSAGFYEAFGMSAASITQTVGVGQTYLGAYRDKNGNALDGGKTYRLHVPPDVPAKLFWSITLYEVETRIPIQNKLQIPDRSSRQPDLKRNQDGSVDLYFAPSAPKGFEQNWIQTIPERAWFAWFRFYGPTQAYFDKSWPLPDIENVE